MRSRSGFALIATLWLVVAISATSLDLALRSRVRRLAMANGLEAGRARAAAEAGIEHVRSRFASALTNGPPPAATALEGVDPWLAVGPLIGDTVRLADVLYTVALRDPSARVNVNTADEEQLRNLLVGLRIDFGDADRIAQAAMDWRDADLEHRPRGAEAETYLREGLPMVPRNGPFQDIGEFRWLRGMTEVAYTRIEPYLTVQGNGLINLNTAPEPVLLSVPGLSSGSVAAILRLRRAGRRLRQLQQLTDAIPPLERDLLLSRAEALLRRVTFDTNEVEVISTGWVDSSPIRAVATAMVGWGATSVAVGWRSVRP